jgi:hypothetical protein
MNVNCNSAEQSAAEGKIGGPEYDPKLGELRQYTSESSAPKTL